MKMIETLTDNSMKTLAMVKLATNVVPPRDDDVADMLAQYRDDMEAGEAYMSDAEYRGILGIDN